MKPRCFALGLVLGIAVGAMIFGGAGCSTPVDPWPERPPDRPGKRIMVTFAPLYSFVSNVAGDDASVLCLLGATGPHDYQPTPRDALKLHRADMVFGIGLGLDDFTSRLVASSGNANVKVIQLGACDGLKDRLRKVGPGEETCCGHHHGGVDPHAWLGIPEAIAMVECIRDTLASEDPDHAEGYKRRAAAYIARLHDLEKYGQDKLKDKKDKNIVTFHDSQRYFARTFGVTIVGAIQAQAGNEPDGQRLRELIKICQDKNVRVIAVEPQYPRTTAATTLLNELHGKGMPDAVFAEVDPIETAPPEELHPDYYEKKMRENIDHLAAALK